MRSILHFGLAQLNDDPAQHFAAFGIYVAGHEALLQTAFNDLNSDPEQDWYYWAARALRLDSAANGQVGISWDVDLRSKRRLRSGYDLLLVMAGASTNVQPMLVTVTMRLLWAQP